MKMKHSSFSGIGRPLDFSYATNRWIAAVTLAAGIVAFVLSFAGGSGWIDAGIDGALTGGTVFLTWALGREVDPDHPLSAFLAGALVVAAVVAYHLPFVVLALWMLLALRVVNHTTGLPPTLPDSIALLLLTGYAVTWSVVAAVICASAFVLNAWLGDRTGRNLALAAAGLATAVLPWSDMTWMPALDALVAAVAVSVVFGAVILRYRVVSSRGDLTGTTLDPRRVRAAQGLALMTVLAAAGALGIRGLVDLSPLVSAMIAAVPFSYSHAV